MLDKLESLTTVCNHIIDLLEEAQIEHGELTGAEALNAVGLTSLLLARLIIQLEIEFGADPFAAGDLVISDVKTVGELADAYLRAASEELKV
jgi:acyl carrier protein